MTQPNCPTNWWTHAEKWARRQHWTYWVYYWQKLIWRQWNVFLISSHSPPRSKITSTSSNNWCIATKILSPKLFTILDPTIRNSGIGWFNTLSNQLRNKLKPKSSIRLSYQHLIKFIKESITSKPNYSNSSISFAQNPKLSPHCSMPNMCHLCKVSARP